MFKTFARQSFCHLLAWVILGSAWFPVNAEQGTQVKQQFPDVLAVKVERHGSNTFDFDVTVSSPYDSARRYADGFRVVGKDSRVYAERKLLHDHADEQPFTRDLHGVTVPLGISTVLIQARDQISGYGGKVVEVALPGR